jgi:hypothetical protein
LFLNKRGEIPEADTDGDDIVLEVFPMIAKTVHQNVIAFDAANGMFDPDADLAQGFVIRLRISSTIDRLLSAFSLSQSIIWEQL